MNNYNCKELRRVKEYRINKMIDTKVIMLNVNKVNITNRINIIVE